MNFKQALSPDELESLLAPHLRLFLSVDVVGSTAFKHRRSAEYGSKPWLKFIHGFFTGFPGMLANHVGTVQAQNARSLQGRAVHGVHRIGVESFADFIAVAQDLRELLLGRVKVEFRRPPRGGKLLRTQPWLNKIEAKRVFLVRGAWNKKFIYELESFPFGNYYDQNDAVSTVGETFTGRARNGGRPRHIGMLRTSPRPHSWNRFKPSDAV